MNTDKFVFIKGPDNEVGKILEERFYSSKSIYDQARALIDQEEAILEKKHLLLLFFPKFVLRAWHEIHNSEEIQKKRYDFDIAEATYKAYREFKEGKMILAITVLNTNRKELNVKYANRNGTVDSLSLPFDIKENTELEHPEFDFINRILLIPYGEAESLWPAKFKKLNGLSGG